MVLRQPALDPSVVPKRQLDDCAAHALEADAARTVQPFAHVLVTQSGLAHVRRSVRSNDGMHAASARRLRAVLESALVSPAPVLHEAG